MVEEKLFFNYVWGFIDVFSRKTTGFHRWALFERWSN